MVEKLFRIKGKGVQYHTDLITQLRLFIQLFGIKQEWRVPLVVAFFDENLSEWHIFDMLNNFSIQISN